MGKHTDTAPITMSGNRLLYIGGPIAAAAGYYFYQAGGDPKAAQKRLEGKQVP